MKTFFFPLFLFFSFYLSAQKKLTVVANKPVAEISPSMWGVFFEDINFGADGGIYAELIKNRSFEFFRPMMGWKVLGKPKTEGDFLVMNRQNADTANPRFLRVALHNAARGSIGLKNEGFRGMGIKNGVGYDFSVMYRQASPPVKMHIELVNEKGDVLGGTTVATTTSGDEWKKATATFTASATVPKATFNIWFEGDGAIDLDMISLFPKDTWKGRPGGMRADMIQMLADMKPGFIRFPGGCIVEGFDLSQRYQWKNTVKPIDQRQLIINRWNFEFSHRAAPDYFQTFGLGFFEYFQLAEDIGAEPMPILNAGMACQFNSAELVPLNQLDPYVQDALDLIEFANGDASTPWGKVRADMGHPAPFNLKMLGVGNENWGPQYIERLKVFAKAIKEKYPDIKLIGSTGTDPDFSPFSPAGFTYLDTELRKMNTDIIDEHYYRKPEWFLQNAGRYDNYPRNGPKIFAGEYAAQSDKAVSALNKNNLQAAIAEAAFMTGMERNADVVTMASYAPLFAHVDAWQWTPDMIWVDNLRLYGTPNYYVQKLFALNKGTHLIRVTENGAPLAGKDSLYASAVLDKNNKQVIVKIVNASASPASFNLDLQGAKPAKGEAVMEVLASSDKLAVNSLDQPKAIVPTSKAIPLKNKTISVQPLSFNVIKIPVQ